MIVAIVAVFLIVFAEGIIMLNMSAQLDALTAAFNEETNALAARIDAFEMAQGSTVTQAQMDALKAISDRLKLLGTPAVVVPVPEPAPAPVVVAAPAPAVEAPATVVAEPPVEPAV